MKNPDIEEMSSDVDKSSKDQEVSLNTMRTSVTDM